MFIPTIKRKDKHIQLKDEEIVNWQKTEVTLSVIMQCVYNPTCKSKILRHF